MVVIMMAVPMVAGELVTIAQRVAMQVAITIVAHDIARAIAMGIALDIVDKFI